MELRRYQSMALFAALGILVAAVAVIATRPRDETPVPSAAFDAVRTGADLIRLRTEGGESASLRRALKAAAKKLMDSPTTHTPLARALLAFAEGRLEEAAAERPSTPFGGGLRGWVLVELGRKAEAAEDFRNALQDAPADWEFRPLFEAALKKAE